MKIFIQKLLITFITLTIITGCLSMEPGNFKNGSPKFLIENYFNGKTKAWGIFEDRFGNVKRQFVVDINGTWDGKTLVLKENFEFNDGERSFREWHITKKEAHIYEGYAGDVVGSAIGKASGNSLNWSYILDLKISDNRSIHVKFDDWMFLQPGGVVLNRARMSKFGIEIGQVTIAFLKLSDKGHYEVN